MNTNPNSSTLPRWFIYAFVALAVLWFATLGTRRLLDPDEGRYAEISREMLVSGNWITPRLDGLKYFEKPPLQYWATAIAYKAVGQNEFAVRLWIGLTSFAGILLAWFSAARLFGPVVGRMSAMLLAGSLMYIVMAHLNTLDMGLAFFFELTLCSFLLAQHAPLRSTAERNWMWLAWAAAALAFLSKGLIALILPSLTLLVYSVVTRELSAWKRLHLLTGLPLFLLISTPWIVLVARANPEFLQFFFWHEQFERFLTTIHDRDAPWWYFLPLLVAGAVPWISLCFADLKRSWQTEVVNGAQPGFHYRRFLWLWVIVVMLFFSKSHSKLAPYIVPVFPMLAILTAEALPRLRTTTIRLHLWVMAGLIGLLTCVVAWVPDTIAGSNSIDLVNALRPATAGGFFIVALAAALAGWWAVKFNLQSAVSILGFGAALGFSLLIFGADALHTTRSAHGLAMQLKPQLTAENTLYSVGQYEQTLPFYLQRTLTLVDYRGELDFGLTQQPALGVADIDAFLRAWAYDAHPIAVLTPDLYKYLHAQGTPMTIIAQQTNLLAVSKP